MAATSRVRSTVALLSVLALVGNMLAGAFMHLGPAHAALGAPLPASAVVVDPVLGVIPICHPAGEATAADEQAPPGRSGASGHCPACTLISKVAVAVALAFEPIAFAVVLRPPQVADRELPLADHLGRGGIRSRAPPSVA